MGGTPGSVAVSGRIVWHPSPDLRVWLAVAVGFLVLTAAIGFSVRWGVLMHVVLALLIAVDAVHLFAAANTEHESIAQVVLRVVCTGIVGILGWLTAVLSFRSLDRNGLRGLLGAVIGAALIGIRGGVANIGTLTHSQVLYAVPAVTARVAVSSTLGMSVGLLVAAGVVFARYRSIASPRAD